MQHVIFVCSKGQECGENVHIIYQCDQHNQIAYKLKLRILLFNTFVLNRQDLKTCQLTKPRENKRCNQYFKASYLRQLVWSVYLPNGSLSFFFRSHFFSSHYAKYC